MTDYFLRPAVGSVPYDDPDYIASDADYQLPLISTIGRGPRGAGVVVQEIEGTEPGDYRLAFVSDATGEAFVTTPNLDPGYLEITGPTHDIVDGETGWMRITHRRGAEARSYDIPIPAGAHGSRVYLSGEDYELRSDQTYVASIEDIVSYGTIDGRERPVPRVGDVVAFTFTEGTEKKLGLGTIQSVDNTYVVFVAHTAIGVPIPTVTERGTWAIDGTDTGIMAQGPRGERGAKGDKGDKGNRGEKGERGYPGQQGERGVDGRPARVKVGEVKTLPSGSSATVSATLNTVTNVTTLSFGIPVGDAGKAIEIQGGVWTLATLPDYDETPLNQAYIVYDGDKQFDLYVRGSEPVLAEDGGPWTVIENWQGRPGGSFRLIPGGYMSGALNDIVRIPMANKDIFKPSENLTDSDVIMDDDGNLGILGSTEDNSGDYTITTVAFLTLPFSSITNIENSSVDWTAILMNPNIDWTQVLGNNENVNWSEILAGSTSNVNWTEVLDSSEIDWNQVLDDVQLTNIKPNMATRAEGLAVIDRVFSEITFDTLTFATTEEGNQAIENVFARLGTTEPAPAKEA